MVQFLFYISWEQRKFEYYFDERNERSGEGELISVTVNSGIKKFSELGRYDTKPEDMSKYKRVVVGDIAYNSMRMWQGASGYSPYTGILSPAYTVITPKNGVSALFFSYVIKRPYMVHQFEINSQGLTSDTWNLKYPAFSKIEVAAPKSVNEQTAISDLFIRIDNLITLHQRKQNGQILGVLPEKCCVKLTNSWEQRKVGDLLIERNEQAPKSDEYPLMAFIANDGVVPKGDRYDRSSLVNDTENKAYKKTKYGDFIYSSNNLETGSIGLNKYGNASISPVYSIFYTTELAHSDFVGRRFVRRDFINEMVKWRQGVIYGQWRIHESDFIKIHIVVPKIEEQRKIGLILDNLDNLITLHQCEYFLCSYKYVYLHLQQSISKKTNSWEQRKLGEMVNEVTRTDPESNAPIMMITANNGFIEQSDRYAFDNAGESLKKYILLEKGELAYNHGASKLRPYGSCFALTTVEKARIPFVYHCFSAKNQNSEFLSIELNSDNVEKQLRRIVSSGARMDGLLNISFKEYSTVELSLPKTEEQDNISYCFRMFDNLITLHQRKLKDFYGGFL